MGNGEGGKRTFFTFEDDSILDLVILEMNQPVVLLSACVPLFQNLPGFFIPSNGYHYAPHEQNPTGRGNEDVHQRGLSGMHQIKIT